ncbi:MAG: hypothetical protein ACRBN8_16410 [Nannocystales bacterium]
MRRIVAPLLLAACSGAPVPVVGTSGDETNPEVTATTALQGTSGDTTAPLSTTDASTSREAAVSGDSSTADDPDGPGFIVAPDGGGPGIECSTLEQDCPRGEKCNAWADDGGSAWNAAKCFPVVEDPDDVDARCSVEGSGISGVDSCDLGSICWFVDGRTLEGTCVSYCAGPHHTLTCEDPDRRCHVATGGVLALCLP